MSASIDALETVRVDALGKQGRVTQLLKTLGGMSPDERQAQGPAIHGLREAVAGAIAARKAHLEQVAFDAQLAGEALDMTLPVDAPAPGTVHPVSQVMDEMAEIFADLGFAVATGPEIEDDWHNFGALNIPETHPARAMQDTFYIAKPEGAADDAAPMVLRTHTSPVQARTMLSKDVQKRLADGGALRIIVPPLTSQYLNLTKNSSLAVAIGYPDLVQIFAGTVLNQTGQAVEVVAITMAVYLTISLATSGLMNLYNRRIALVER